MTDTTHTPGPWRRGKTSGSYWDNAICEGPSIIATVIGDGYPLGEGWGPRAEANARLIAAAPDLLAACIDALEVECDMAESPDSELAQRLRAAIAKATGEETTA